MSRELLYQDQLETSYHHYDHQTKITRIETVYNVEPVIEINKELQKDKDYSRQGIKGGWWHYGTIPNGVIAKWKEEGIDFFNRDHWGAVLRKLRDPAYRYLKTTSGRL